MIVYVVSSCFVNVGTEFYWFKITRSGEARDPDEKDPATIASEILSLCGSEENETVNKEQFIAG